MGLRTAASQLGLQVVVRKIGRHRPARNPAPNSLNVLCLGPWDYRFPRLARGAGAFILYTSWPIWDSSYSARFPETKLRRIRRQWKSVLESDAVFVAGTAQNVVNGIHAAFDLKHEAVAVGHTIGTRFYEMKRADHSASPTLGIVTRPGEQKGLSRALSVLQGSMAKRIIVAGETDLESSCVTAEVELRGRLTGDQMAHFVEEIDILLVPSARSARWEELFGMAAAEAMAAGRPVIATSHEGPTALLGHRLREYAVSESSFVAYGSILVDRLASDPSLYAHVSAISRDQAHQYRPEIVAERWIELLRFALAARSAA